MSAAAEPMREISDAAAALAAADEDLAAVADELRAAERQAAAERLDRIRAAFDARVAAEARLNDLIDANRGCFASPRTLTLGGVTFGLRKRVGELRGPKGERLADVKDAVIDSIRRLMPHRAGELMRVTEALDVSALRKLDAKDLRRLKCRVEGAGDGVTITVQRPELVKFADNVLRAHSAHGR